MFLVCGRAKLAVCVGVVGASAVGVALAAICYWSKRRRLRGIRDRNGYAARRRPRKPIGYADLRSVRLLRRLRLEPSFRHSLFCRGCLSPDASSLWLLFEQEVKEDSGATHIRLVVCRYSLLTFRTVPVIVFDNFVRAGNMNFSFCDKYFILEAQNQGRIDLFTCDFTGNLRRMRLAVPDVGETVCGRLYYDGISPYSDRLFMHRFGADSPPKLRIFRYEAPLQGDDEWQIRSVHTKTLPIRDPFWIPGTTFYIGSFFGPGMTMGFIVNEFDSEWEYCYLYHGDLEIGEMKQFRDSTEAMPTRQELGIRRFFTFGEATEETEGRFPIFAYDLQPRTLQALALDSLLKSSPGLKDQEPKVLEAIGIPPAIVDELAEHKALEARADSITTVDLEKL